MRRHDLLTVDPVVWEAMLGRHPTSRDLPLLADWARQGWPVIVRRRMAGDAPDAVPAALPLPPDLDLLWSGRRPNPRRDARRRTASAGSRQPNSDRWRSGAAGRICVQLARVRGRSGLFSMLLKTMDGAEMRATAGLFQGYASS